MPDLNDEIGELRDLRARVSEATEEAEEHVRQMVAAGEILDEMIADRQDPGDGDEVAKQRRRHLNIGSGVLWTAMASANTVRESPAAIAVARAAVAGATAMVIAFPGGIGEQQPGAAEPRPHADIPASHRSAPAAGPQRQPGGRHAQQSRSRPERPRALAAIKLHRGVAKKEQTAAAETHAAAKSPTKKRPRAGTIRLRKVAVRLLWRG